MHTIVFNWSEKPVFVDQVIMEICDDWRRGFLIFTCPLRERAPTTRFDGTGITNHVVVDGTCQRDILALVKRMENGADQMISITFSTCIVVLRSNGHLWDPSVLMFDRGKKSVPSNTTIRIIRDDICWSVLPARPLGKCTPTRMPYGCCRAG